MADISTMQAGFNPPVLPINYIQGSGIIPSEQVILKFPENIPRGTEVRALDSPSWLRIIIDKMIPDPANFTRDLGVDFIFEIDSAVARYMATGNYSENVTMEYRNGIDQRRRFHMTVNLQISKIVPFGIHPGGFSFYQWFGDPAPPAQRLQVSSEYNWTILADKPWVKLSQTTGTGLSSVLISVETNGMPDGYYESTFIVDNGQKNQTGVISLIIRPTESKDDHLSISPQILEYSINSTQPATTEKAVSIDSNLAVTITKNVAWLSLSHATFPAGVNTLVAALQNTSAIPVGVHSGAITVEAGSIVRTINVLLTVIDGLPAELPGRLYFSAARNKLEMTTPTGNQEAVLSFETTATDGLHKYERKIPYFRNALAVVIGLETYKLLKPNALPARLATSFFAPLWPLSMNISVRDKRIGSQESTLRKNYYGMKFVNGKKPAEALKRLFDTADIQNFEDTDPNSTPEFPTNFRLSTFPKKAVLPADGIVCFTFYSKLAVSALQISGASLNTEIPITLTGTSIYTALIDLSDFELEKGNSFLISCGIISTKIQIKDHDLPTVQLIWLNQWDSPEVFNCNGIVSIEEEEDSEMVELNRDGASYTEITEIKTPRSFEVLTGKIYSDGEVEHLATIIRAKKIWLEIAGERFEVIPNFGNIKTMETRRFSRDFKLKFNSASR